MERVASFLPDGPAGQHQARLSTPPSLLPQILSTLDTTSHFQERQISLVLTTATLDWRASDAEQEEGWCDTRLFLILFLILFSLVQIGTLTRASWPPIRL